MAGLLGHGDAFVLRDPAGIRPAYYYKDDEVVVVASERPAIQTVFNVNYDEVFKNWIQGMPSSSKKQRRRVNIEEVFQPTERKACSFERIYFSRGSDQEIYQERKRAWETCLSKNSKSYRGRFKAYGFFLYPQYCRDLLLWNGQRSAKLSE